MIYLHNHIEVSDKIMINIDIKYNPFKMETVFLVNGTLVTKTFSNFSSMPLEEWIGDFLDELPYQFNGEDSFNLHFSGLKENCDFVKDFLEKRKDKKININLSFYEIEETRQRLNLLLSTSKSMELFFYDNLIVKNKKQITNELIKYLSKVNEYNDSNPRGVYVLVKQLFNIIKFDFLKNELSEYFIINNKKLNKLKKEAIFLDEKLITISEAERYINQLEKDSESMANRMVEDICGKCESSFKDEMSNLSKLYELNQKANNLKLKSFENYKKMIGKHKEIMALMDDGYSPTLDYVNKECLEFIRDYEKEERIIAIKKLVKEINSDEIYLLKKELFYRNLDDIKESIYLLPSISNSTILESMIINSLELNHKISKKCDDFKFNGESVIGLGTELSELMLFPNKWIETNNFKLENNYTELSPGKNVIITSAFFEDMKYYINNEFNIFINTSRTKLKEKYMSAIKKFALSRKKELNEQYHTICLEKRDVDNKINSVELEIKESIESQEKLNSYEIAINKIIN